MSEEKKNLRKELNEFDLEYVAGGNTAVSASDTFETCPKCLSAVRIQNGNTMSKHIDSEGCIMIQKIKGLL